MPRKIVKVTCTRCGIAQDPQDPICKHMVASLGGKASQAQRRLDGTYGPDFMAKIGRKGAAARWWGGSQK